MVDLTDPRVFEAVVDSLETGVYLVDHDRKIVYWNRGAERISGYKRHDVTGRYCRDDLLVHCDENEKRPRQRGRPPERRRPTRRETPLTGLHDLKIIGY